jgi:hypothetical protein
MTSAPAFCRGVAAQAGSDVGANQRKNSLRSLVRNAQLLRGFFQ